MVFICRCPNASYSVLSIVVGAIPRRDAVARSITRETASPPGCWSVATSSSSGNCFRRSTNLLVQSLNSFGSGSSSVYWYCVRLTRSSTVMFCTGCMNSWMPRTSLSFVCKRRMTSEAFRFRFSSGFKLMDSLPLLVVMFVPSAPIKEERLSTAGS